MRNDINARATIARLANELNQHGGRNEEVAGLLCEAVWLAWTRDVEAQARGESGVYLRTLLDAVTPAMEMMVIELKGTP